MTTRRLFMLQLSLGSSALLAGQSMAQVPTLVETDAQANALGYKADSSKVDAKKYPAHTAGQACKSCQLYQGKPTDAMGACPLYSGKQVAMSGWCSAYRKKA
ncbi:MAG: high-potential iron-sulfur protein [Massilia sp.]|nr:high-potential iron-sulfur protein [Massilia sp.]